MSTESAFLVAVIVNDLDEFGEIVGESYRPVCIFSNRAAADWYAAAMSRWNAKGKHVKKELAGRHPTCAEPLETVPASEVSRHAKYGVIEMPIDPWFLPP